jgi:two-component system, OmpR family, sensor kinase
MISVFPRGRKFSIQQTLLLWLVPTFLIVAMLTAGVSYRMYTHMVADFLDGQMVQLGDSVAQNGNAGQPQSPTAERVLGQGIYVVQVFGSDGQLAAASWDGVTAQRMSRPGLHDMQDGGRPWRVYTAAARGSQTVQVLQSAGFREHLAFERAGVAAAPVLVLLPLFMLVLFGVVRAISRSLSAIGNQAALQDVHSITELPLDRVPDEIRPLVSSFNSLLARLRDSFAAQRRFVQDAAHELRTPIAAVRLQLENLRDELGDRPAVQQLQQLEAGVRRAQRLVDQMLKMSRQEVAAAEATAGVDLHAQLRDCINIHLALADQRQIDLGLVAPDSAAPVTLRCAPSDLRSALDNLVENALRYTPEGGVVDVRLQAEPGRTVVEVVDTGPGIAQEFLPRVFDRFYRVPGSTAGGSGLGLAIAHAAAQRCGMKLTLRNRTDCTGLVARLEVMAGVVTGR